MQPGQSFCAGLRDAFSEDVHGIGLDHARHHQYVVLIEVSAGTGQHLDAGHLRLLHGQRAGLVEEHVRDAAEVLQHVLCLDQDSRLG